MHILKLFTAAIAIQFSSVAMSTTTSTPSTLYFGDFFTSDYSLSLRLWTDGTIGQVSSNNIRSWNYDIRFPKRGLNLTVYSSDVSSFLNVSGSVIADGRKISIDVDAPESQFGLGALRQSKIYSVINFAGVGMASPFSGIPDRSFSYGTEILNSYIQPFSEFNAISGQHVFAVMVPEPVVWIELLLGFAIVGSISRRLAFRSSRLASS